MNFSPRCSVICKQTRLIYLRFRVFLVTFERQLSVACKSINLIFYHKKVFFAFKTLFFSVLSQNGGLITNHVTLMSAKSFGFTRRFIRILLRVGREGLNLELKFVWALWGSGGNLWAIYVIFRRKMAILTPFR